MFVATEALQARGNPFYRAFDALLDRHGFDEFVEDLCRPFYADEEGRPGIPPGVYFRMMMVGYLEGLDSERAIARECDRAFDLSMFLGYGVEGKPPGHSTLSKTRKRLSLEVHQKVFEWVLRALWRSSLLRGKTMGVDSTYADANAAMRKIVRRRRKRKTGYKAWLTEMAVGAGIENPTDEDLKAYDKSRSKKLSNKDWVHPHDPDARIAKMKDGRTHMAHKVEQAVDLDTGAVVAVTVQTTDGGDTASLSTTLDEASERLSSIDVVPEEVVADKGYHANKTMTDLKTRKVRSYISEPKRGRRKWKKNRAAQQPTYANRRRIRGRRGKRLLRRRGEVVERTFAHLLETGGLRRTYLRGHHEIRKRLLIHVCGFNMGLLMRQQFGVGTPRALQGMARLRAAILAQV